MRCPNLNFVFDLDDLTYTRQLDENGIMIGFVLKVPAFTNVITATITITDENSNTIYSLGTLAKGTTHVVGEGLATDATICVPINRDFTATVTLSGAAGGTGGTVEFKPFIQEG